MNEEILKKLYEGAKLVGDMPDYDQFVLDMQDDDKLGRFRNSMAEYYDIPEVEQLKLDLGIVKKKEDTESPSEDGSLDSQESKFEIPGIPFYGFMSEAISRGLAQGATTDESLALMYGGKDVSDEDIQKYIKVNEIAESLGTSKEMREFNEQYEKDVDSGDSGTLAFIKAIARNPKVAAEVSITSIAQMARSAVSSGEAFSIVAAGAGTGAGLGAYLGTFTGPLAPVSSTVGAITGAAKGAMAAAGGLTEVAASFTEFLKEELGEKDFTQENIREVLEDKEAKQRIVNRSLGRGATIATIDFLTAGVSGKAVSGITKVGKTGKALRTAAATSIEMTGGGLGEAAARVVAGQEMEARDIGLETVGEAPGAGVSGPLGLLNAPKYSVNKGRLSKNDFLDIVKTASDEDILAMNVKIDNDEAMSTIYSDRVKKASTRRKIDPSITDEADINTVVDLELKIKDLKTKDSSSARNRIKELEAQIKEVQSKYQAFEPTAEPTVEPTVTEPAPQTVAQALNRPATLTSLGGSVLETPIEGDLYVEGQQVVIEDEAGNITEIGNVDEISDSTLQEIGIELAEPAVKPMTDGNLMFEDRVLLSDKKGIKRNKRGEISRVTLREQDGAFVTLRGANAEEAAYQILLREATSPEQAEFINQQLEQDEEFQNELRKVTEPTEAEATADTQQATKQAYVEELKRTKEENPETYWTVSEVTPEVAKQGTLIDDQDGSAFVKDDGDIIGVFKKKISKAKGVAQKLLQKAVEAGGVKLDNFDNYLTPIYKKAGFRVAGRVPFNEEYAPDGWKPEFGKPDVVAMVYDPNNELDIEERTFDDYDQMIEYRDSFLLDDQTRINKESDDFLSSVGQKPLFQKEQAETDQSEIDLITEEMNELSDERAAFDVPSDLTTKIKTKIKSLVDRFKGNVKTIKDISVFNGIPFIFTISDQLTTGDFVNPVTGNTLKFFGGLGFNMTNKTSAWANVTEDTAKQTLSTAQEVYAKNKDLFDRLWAEGKLPNGHVPMAVVKMGQESIESNEAIFRVVSDNVKSKFSLKDRTAAKNNLLRQLKGKKANKRVVDFVSKYKTIDEVLDNVTEIPLGLRSEVGTFMFYGSPSLGAPTKPGTPKSPVLKSLLDGKDNSLRALFHLPTINNQVREEATKDIPDGHIISIVGVDVINSKVTSTQDGDFQHQNYNYGVKGELIGVLENPVHAADVFPEMYSKSVYTFKENKRGTLPSPERAVSQSVAASGPVAITKAFRGARMSTKMSTLDIVLGKLRQAFPAVTVVSTQAEFDAAVNSPDVTKYSREGDIIYGFTKDGKVFLNPKIATTNTAIHEYGHVWMNFVEENNPALLQKGFDLLEGTDTLKEKIRIHGDNKTARMEALADLIGNKGESIVNAGQKSKFKNWLNAMYTYIKKKFKAFSDMSADEFQDMSLKQFVEGVLSDLVSGREVTDKVVRSVDTTFQKVNANDLIEKGIENGFSKQAIKLGLERIGADVSGFNDAYSAAKAKYDKNTGRPRRVEVDDIYDRSKKAIQDKVKKRNLKFYRDKTRELVLDRQTRIKNLLNGIGSKEAQKAVNLLVTKAGASGYANFRFKEADQKIFKGLSVADTETLDKIIYARRIDAINDNRKQRGLESYVGIEGYNQETAKRNLKEIKDDIGVEKFNDLNKRATEYFKVFNQSLDRMREANLISEEVYIQLKETDYSPIKTIKYLVPNDYDVAQIDRMAQITGMNRDLIKSLSDENVNEVIMDSRWLLMTNVSMVEARVSENRMLNAVYDAIDSATNEQVKGIEDYIKPNPVFDYTKTGKPRYKYDVIKVPQGFVKVGFLRDGNRLDLVVQEVHARQLLDVKTDQKGLRFASKWSAVNILRFFATAANPVFIIPNSAIDFANILFLSEVYSKNKFSGGARLAFDAVSNFLSKVGGTKGYNKVYEEYMLHGGSMDYLASDGLRVLEDLTFKKSLNPAKKALLSIARALSYTGESSEIAFRLAVYNKSKENQIKDFKKTNKRDPDAQEMEDIMFGAAREARETIDFAQGGSVVKGADKILPYFNAANQGFRKGLDYATENPLGFTTSVLQGMLMSASLTSLGIFLLLRAIGDDDEEEVKRVLNSVSNHEKANYHVIFTGRKNDEGEYEYYRIRKLPLTSAASTLAEQITISAMMEYKGIDYNIDYNMLLENVKSAAPIVPTAKNILSRNPALSALITYHFNYDMFYDQEVFRGPRDKKIKPSVEGIYDNRVEMIYKDLAKVLSPGLELSPKRAQAAVEKMITSENTNPTIGLIYSGYDGIRSIFSEGPGMNDELNTFIDRTVDNTSKKLVRYTNKNLIVYKQEADVEADRIEADTEKYLAEQKMYSEIRKRYKDDKGEFTAGEFIDLIEENFEPDDYSKYKKKYLAYIKNINADRAILDIIFEDSPEIQAKMLFNKYGDALEQEELDELISTSKAARRKLSKKGLYIYRQKYQNR